uniref:Uncharacterized protein n=1 Tax=Romanomermis culicivorax TaxID=13658 RepID=A0A915HY26_ROMCU
MEQEFTLDEKRHNLKWLKQNMHTLFDYKTADYWVNIYQHSIQDNQFQLGAVYYQGSDSQLSDSQVSDSQLSDSQLNDSQLIDSQLREFPNFHTYNNEKRKHAEL